jgi:hypothetical protein
MTQAAILEQVNIIKVATQNATRSREAARQFLIDAGIIIEEEVKKPAKKIK